MAGAAAHTEVFDGVTFELRPFAKEATNPDWVCVRKKPRLVQQYRALAEELQGCRMMEVGVDQGGGTSLFLKLFKPQQLLAIELSKKPVPKLMDFLAKHDNDDCVDVRWGVDQSDTDTVPRLVEETFDNTPLDLVVDDASHLLEQTTITFDMLFPRLRPDGVYVIEDWSSEHLMEARFTQEIESNPFGELAKEVANLDSVEYDTPLSFLICQLLVVSARHPELISSVHIEKSICVIRRGHADIDPTKSIVDYMGDLGRWMLNC
ncbi:Mycinamicin VI 2''-O-methyltransferase [Halioglobus japonicus]|nr:Mycinamicin VI 2''-O-methyltransferase [Halioglobus japonicus]